MMKAIFDLTPYQIPLSTIRTFIILFTILGSYFIRKTSSIIVKILIVVVVALLLTSNLARFFNFNDIINL